MLRTLRKLTSTCLHGEVRATRNVNVVHGDLKQLTPALRKFIEGNVRLCQPDNLHICDGSDAENDHIHATMVRQGTFRPLPKFENCWYARSDPRDVARVEGVTYMSTAERRDTVPVPIGKVKSALGNWISPQDCEDEIYDRFPGCMRGRTMYVIPFSMGPVGGRISKIGIELTDSPYVVVSMRIMTRMGSAVLKHLAESKTDFIRSLHSVGVPIDKNGKPIGEDAPTNYMPTWPCNPPKTFITHIPEMNEIISYGSGYGGNALLGKKCFSLRIGSTIARREGWLAEHMLIVGVTNPKGVKKYIAAAFPSACGKTNFAMLQPTIPGYKVETVGDDIAWMKFDDNGDGRLYGINPEAGFFGVCPGTSNKTNPIAMQTIMKNSIFTNTATTSDGGVYWKGLEEVLKPGIEVTTWKNQPNWKNTPTSEPAAHPNSRFTTPARQCPTIDPDWELERGVPISAIVFGGRRPQGVPLVYQSFNWQHGVFVGGAMRSETTFASAEGAAGKQIVHDPFAMRPFFGYNFGHYMGHWLSMPRPSRKMPKIFHVNWFREGADGGFLWPGYGENVRVMDWIIRRCDDEPCAETTPVGFVPKLDAFVTKGLEGVVSNDALREMFRIDKKFWQQEAKTIRDYLETEVNVDLPEAIRQEAINLQKRVDAMP